MPQNGSLHYLKNNYTLPASRGHFLHSFVIVIGNENIFIDVIDNYM